MYLTYILMGLTIIVSLYAFSNQKILAALILNPYAVSRYKQYHRFVTSGFIHNDHLHLIFNMFSFYFFGRAVEMVFRSLFGDMLGAIYFILLYILAIIVSDIPSFLRHKSNPRYNSLGASGGVAAVIFAFIIFMPLEKICIYFALCLPGFILGTLYILFSWYQGRKANDNINHDAHLYGALFGFIFCVVIYPPSFMYFVEQIRNWEVLDFLN
jgi:membrane associated rhomboid family serine protease